MTSPLMLVLKFLFLAGLLVSTILSIFPLRGRADRRRKLVYDFGFAVCVIGLFGLWAWEEAHYENSAMFVLMLVGFGCGVASMTTSIWRWRQGKRTRDTSVHGS
jgi:hypothetical protein